MNIKQINDIVSDYRATEKYRYAVYGEDYYKSRNTAIMNRKKLVYLPGIENVAENPFGSNHKLPSGHLKKIIDQKVQYLLGNGIKMDDKELEILDSYFVSEDGNSGIGETLLDLGMEASKKSEAWLYAYKENKKLKFIQIPTEQITPVYDDKGKLTHVIRDYEINGLAVRIVTDDKEHARYEKRRDPVTDKMEYMLADQSGHYTTYEEFSGQMIGEPEQHSFTTIPYICLKNSKDETSDLYRIKPLIDVYDIINSDFANNIDDMQEAFLTLKGYSGDAKNLSEFMKELKNLKVLAVSEDGEAGIQQLQIPTEARTVFLDRLKNEIYEASMAVDLKNVAGGSNITNVYIQAMLTDLDLKADQFENEVRKFLYRFIDFVNKNDAKSITYDFSFERSLIMNRMEAVEMLLKLTGILSQKTIRELLPYDIDQDEEEKRLEAETTPITLIPPENMDGEEGELTDGEQND